MLHVSLMFSELSMGSSGHTGTAFNTMLYTQPCTQQSGATNQPPLFLCCTPWHWRPVLPGAHLAPSWCSSACHSHDLPRAPWVGLRLCEQCQLPSLLRNPSAVSSEGRVSQTRGASLPKPFPARPVESPHRAGFPVKPGNGGPA